MSQLGCEFFISRDGAFGDLPFGRDSNECASASPLAQAASCPTRRKSRRDGAASVVVAHEPAPQGSSWASRLIASTGERDALEGTAARVVNI